MAAKDSKMARAQGGQLPVELLPTDAARIYTHVHSVLVLGVLYANFSATIRDPVSSLALLTLPLCALQAVYMVIASAAFRRLQAQSNSSEDKPGVDRLSLHTYHPRDPPLPDPRDAARHCRPGPARRAADLAHPPHRAAGHAPGAPRDRAALLLARHRRRRVARPRLARRARRRDPRRRGGRVRRRLARRPCPPLDWDREWQKWPVTVVVGVYAGWAVGKLLGGTVGFGRRIVFDGSGGVD